MSRTGLRCSVCVVLSVLASWASVGTVEATSGVPPSLVGTWGKSISAATWNKDHLNGEPAGRYAMKIEQNGRTGLYSGSVGGGALPLSTMTAAFSDHTVTFGATSNGVCPGRGIYHWVVSRSKLKLAVSKDGCRLRVVFLTAGPFALEH